MKNSKFPSLLLSTLLGAGLLTSRAPAASDVLITEFMAVNDRTLADEDGANPDWLEIYNSGTNAVNLAGWYLTDSAANLTQWQFPATSLPPDGYLVVFASGKNRAVAGLPLHTNFKLGNNGGYLALVKPDGATVAFSYPIYPVQVADVSYGIPVQQTSSTLLNTGAAARVFVPADDSLALTWTSLGFSDATPTFTVTPMGCGVVQLSADGHSAHFTPTAGFSGVTSLEYQVTGKDGTSYTAHVAVAVQP